MVGSGLVILCFTVMARKEACFVNTGLCFGRYGNTGYVFCQCIDGLRMYRKYCGMYS